MPVKFNALPPTHPSPALPKSVYAEHLQSSPIKSSTSVTKKETKSQKQTVLKDDETDIHPGVITDKKTGLSLSFKGSRTINLGDYNSATVAVMLTVPCEPGELEATYEWATDWVSKKITEATQDALGL